MRQYLSRQCTKIAADQVQQNPIPLENLRDAHAYVLLGSAGAGKTEAFKREAAADETGIYVTAFEFLTGNPRESWHNGVLFIDGLDEFRAWSPDLDSHPSAIWRKLNHLGSPRFRIACRPGYWYGALDRQHLSAGHRDESIQVMRLEPLTGDDIIKNLRANLGVEDPDGFLNKLRRSRLETLVGNPLYAEFLVRASSTGQWPTSLTEAYSMACRKLLEEQNQGHSFAPEPNVDPEDLAQEAGYLCALLLLSANRGITVAGSRAIGGYPRMNHIPSLNPQVQRQVVRSALFVKASEGQLTPVHHGTAEFLAARYLADLIRQGLPIARVMALISDPDTGFLPSLAGVAAWLASLCVAARPEIVACDPLAIVSHGEWTGFNAAEKRLVLKNLQTVARANPWLRGECSWDVPLGGFVDVDLACDVSTVLAQPERDESHCSYVRLIIRGLLAGPPQLTLARPLLSVANSDTWPMDIRCSAVEALVKMQAEESLNAVPLKELLDVAYSMPSAAPTDDLIGTLLWSLYPKCLSVAELARYLREPAQLNRRSRYQVFWERDFIEQSKPFAIVSLLNALREPLNRLLSDSADSSQGRTWVTGLPVMMLRHLLSSIPEALSKQDTVYWLDFAGSQRRTQRFRTQCTQDDHYFFGNWLSQHPEVQKALIKHGARNYESAAHSFVCMTRFVESGRFGAQRPADYGHWCANMAIGTTQKDLARWYVWEAASFVHHADHPDPDLRRRVGELLVGKPDLCQVYWGRLDVLGGRHSGSPEQEWPSTQDESFTEIRSNVQLELQALYSNSCPPQLLHQIAVTYLDGFADVSGKTPLKRLHMLLGDDPELLSASLAGISGAISRPDLPAWTEIIKLAPDDRIHYLAYPFMAGLADHFHSCPPAQVSLNQKQARLALAIHFSVRRLRHLEAEQCPPNWLQSLLEREPTLVADVWTKSARGLLLGGKDSLADVHRLVENSSYALLAKIASIPLLKAIPIQCKTSQLPIVRALMLAALRHGDIGRLTELTRAKLKSKSMNASQVVYWMVMGLVLRPEGFKNRLRAFVEGNSLRVQRLVEMFAFGGLAARIGLSPGQAGVLELLIELMAPHAQKTPNTGKAYWVTWPIRAYGCIQVLMRQLTEDPSEDATVALERLTKSDRLTGWRLHLKDGLYRQKNIRRKENLKPPSIVQVARSLSNRQPANPPDLWAVAVEVLENIAREIHDGRDSHWRQYWNVNSFNRPIRPRPENACRDALLVTLRRDLRCFEISVEAEGRYANDARADIRLSAGGSMNIPIEIKRSCHKDWFSAIRTQLIEKYTRDPGASGYGIYLVFWFGKTEHCQPLPASGRLPETPAELESDLLNNLSDSERRRIAVCVVDVSAPND